MKCTDIDWNICVIAITYSLLSLFIDKKQIVSRLQSLYVSKKPNEIDSVELGQRPAAIVTFMNERGSTLIQSSKLWQKNGIKPEGYILSYEEFRTIADMESDDKQMQSLNDDEGLKEPKLSQLVESKALRIC